MNGSSPKWHSLLQARKEGLTDISRKRYIPEFCTRIGVVTHLLAASLIDVMYAVSVKPL